MFKYIFCLIIFLLLILLIYNIRNTYKETPKEEFSNLMINGNFENGKNVVNHTNQNGYNKIIMKKNPGKSSYVLEQKKTDNLTFYQLLANNEKNCKYILYFWMSIDDNKNINELNFEKLIKINIQNEDFGNYIPRLNYNIVQKVSMTNDDNTWYLIKYDFLSGNNTKDKMEIYLNYSDSLQYDTYYFTDIALYKVLIDAENFIYNEKLIAYVDGYNYESNIPTWHDLSGNGNDLFWSNIPSTDYTKGFLNTMRMKLLGFSANTLSNDKFSILICLNKNYENPASDIAQDAKDPISSSYLISVPGNNRYSFEIELKDNYLYLVTENNTIRSKNELIIFNKSLITIEYDEGTINILQDGLNILSSKINKLYFSGDNITFNRNKNLDLNFYSILFYNRIIPKEELNDIREYFITNQDKNFNTPDINIHHMSQTAQYTDNNKNNNIDNKLFKPFSKKMNIPFDNFEKDSFIDKFDNQNNILGEESDYEMTSNYKTTSSCKTPTTLDTCPKVYKKNGNYTIYIAPNSYYAGVLNYSGEKSYGKNLDKARLIYTYNFPKCPIPTELLPGEGKNNLNTCPYIVNDANPCYTHACAGVNWKVDDYKDLNLSKNCKKSVSNYCQINYKLDDNCVCWDPKMKDDPKCIEYRRHFEDPNDYCSPNQFKIEEHPDFNKYVKKDNIPCWGCNLNM